MKEDRCRRLDGREKVAGGRLWFLSRGGAQQVRIKRMERGREKQLSLSHHNTAVDCPNVRLSLKEN